MPAFKGHLDRQADRRRLRLRREGDRRQPDRLTLSLPDGFPRDVEVVATDLDRTLIWRTTSCGRATLAALRARARGRAARDRRHRPDGAVGAARARAGRARRAAHLLPGRGRRRRRRDVAAARADPARARARGDRRRRGRGLSASTSTSTTSSTSPSRRPRRRALRELPAIELHDVGDLLAWLDEPPTKLVCVGDPDELDGLEARMKAHFGGRLYITKSLPFFLEFAAAGVTKGSGLDFLAEHLGFSREQTVAFGDGENDLELVEWAAYGIAVENAHDRVKAVADWVCPPAAEEGVAQVLEALLDSTSDDRPPRSPRRPRRLPRRARAQGRGRALRRAARGRRALARAAAAGRGAARAQKLKGKPTPEQLEELTRVKEELQPLEAASSPRPRQRREALLDHVPNPPDRGTPDGDERRGRGRGQARRRAAELRLRAARPPRARAAHGWIDVERGAKLSGSRFGYRVGDSRSSRWRSTAWRSRGSRRRATRR